MLFTFYGTYIHIARTALLSVVLLNSDMHSPSTTANTGVLDCHLVLYLLVVT
jgi:hypothetical protein